jgi:hypothetical protein
MTEFSDAGSLLRAATPAETTFNDRNGSGCAFRACCSKAAAIGLRQILAVQTTSSVSGIVQGVEWTQKGGDCKDGNPGIGAAAFTLSATAGA